MGKTLGPAACRAGWVLGSTFQPESPYTVPVEICSYNGSWLLWDIIYSQSPRPSYLSIFFLFDTLEPRRNSTNTAVVSGHVVAKGHEVIEDKSGPTCKEVAMSRRGLQLHFLWFVTGRWLKELGWKGGKNIQSYFGVHHGFWPIDKLVPKAFLGVPRSIWKLFRTLKKRIWSGCVHLTISAEIWSPKLPVFGNSEAP